MYRWPITQLKRPRGYRNGIGQIHSQGFSGISEKTFKNKKKPTHQPSLGVGFAVAAQLDEYNGAAAKELLQGVESLMKEADPAQVASQLRGRYRVQVQRPGSNPGLIFYAVSGADGHTFGDIHDLGRQNAYV